MNKRGNILEFEDADGISLSNIFNIFRSNIRLFIIIVATITSLTIVYSLLLPNVYQAEVIAIAAEETSRPNPVRNSFSGIASIAGISIPSGPADKVQTSIEIAQSKKFNILFAKSENLLPILFEEDWDDATNTWNENLEPSDLAIQSELKSHYSISYDKRDGIIRFTFNWDDPVLAAMYANNFVTSVNNYIREDEISEAEKSIDYLKREIEKTSIVDIKNVLNLLIQDQLQTTMLANVREDYAFKVIDPAMVPKTRIKPQRRQMVIIGFMLGILIGLSSIFLFSKKEEILTIFD